MILHCSRFIFVYLLLRQHESFLTIKTHQDNIDNKTNLRILCP